MGKPHIFLTPSVGDPHASNGVERSCPGFKYSASCKTEEELLIN